MSVLETPHIYDLDRQALVAWMEEEGEPSYRADQVWHWLYHELATSAEQITTLPLPLRQQMATDFRFSALEESLTASSEDGQTTKTLFSLEQGGPPIEAVLMRYDERRTACISTQVGCAMGCVFCATGQMGFHRHLSAGEIIEQVLYFERRLRSVGERLTNVVVMGMGEPLHNYEATMEALDRLHDPDGYNFGARRFTVSTVGLVPLIERFTEERRPYNLAVSLHAATDEARSALLPVNRRYPIDGLLQACRRYVRASGRRITFEWALVHEENDSPAEARRLAELLENLHCHVNLIPLNPTEGYRGEPSQRQRAEAFRAILEGDGIPCTIRVRRGLDIQAGCGQLATEWSEVESTS